MFPTNKKRIIPAFLGFALLSATVVSFSQFRAGVEGTVTDASGAAVPGAAVTLRNNQTGATRKTTTNSRGFYTFTFLPPGSYTATASKGGFKTTTLNNVGVAAQQTQGLNITLSLGTVSQRVTVSARTNPAFQTQSASISGTITNQQIKALPQIGGDPYELIRLAPGVFGDGQRQGNGNAENLPNTTGPGGSNLDIFEVENQIPIVANGQRLSENNYKVDGVSVNSLTWGGAAVLTANQDSVQEMDVSSVSYDAQNGRNSGALIDVVTKSGTNQFHGDGNFLRQSPGLNAYNSWGGGVWGAGRARQQPVFAIRRQHRRAH